VAEAAQYLDSQALNRLMHLTLQARSPMEGSVSGLHKSPHRGSSVEFAEYRNYVPGDDIRRLDWRVNFGSGLFNKLDYAKRLAATLAYITAHQGDAVGLVCAAGKTFLEVPPRRNPAHLRTFFEALEKARAHGPTGLIAALHGVAEKVRRRALVIVLSDFFCELDPLLNCFQHLRFQKHDLALFQLLDRSELEFQFDRPLRFVDLESSASIVTEPAGIREEYLRQIGLFLEGLRSGCHEFGADYRRVVTDEDYEKVLADFLVERAALAASHQ
jgi:uncharacterized protein (DUF58 family)